MSWDSTERSLAYHKWTTLKVTCTQWAAKITVGKRFASSSPLYPAGW